MNEFNVYTPLAFEWNKMGILLQGSRSSSVSIETRLWAGHPGFNSQQV